MDASKIMEMVKAVPGLTDVHWEGDRLVAYKTAEVHQVDMACKILTGTPLERTLETTPVPTPTPAPRHMKKSPGASSRGFFTPSVTGPGNRGWTQENDEHLRNIVTGFPGIITCTRDGTKIMDSVRHEVELVVSGSFGSAHWWRNMGQGLKIMEGMKFQSIGDVLDDIHATLEDIQAEITRNGYHWPPVKNGCRKQASLLEFIVSRNREGFCWSPWVEARSRDFGSWEDAREMMQEPWRTLMDQLFRETWIYKKNATSNVMYRWWKGANKFRIWYNLNRETLMEQPGTGSSVLWATKSAVMGVIRDWTMETGNMPASFIGPWSDQWGDFRRWLESNRKTTLPRR